MKSAQLFTNNGANVALELEVMGRKGFFLKPARRPQLPGNPWVWYAPTLMGGYPGESNVWLITKLLDAGVAVCGMDIGESYGSPAGQKIFSEFHRRLVREHALQPQARLLPQSRGGLMLYSWAKENPEFVQCAAGIYPVCDLRSYPGLQEACGAYGMTEAELRTSLTKVNPIDGLEPLARRKIPILHIHGDQDQSVPLEANSGEFCRRYTALGGPMKVIVIHGKGHEECPEFHQSQKLVDFLISGGSFK